MTFEEHLQRLIRMDDLIRRKATGTPDEFASKMETSRPTIYRDISDLKNRGAEVKYCKHRQSFF